MLLFSARMLELRLDIKRIHDRLARAPEFFQCNGTATDHFLPAFSKSGYWEEKWKILKWMTC
jgi:hypothetical protein